MPAARSDTTSVDAGAPRESVKAEGTAAAKDSGAPATDSVPLTVATAKAHADGKHYALDVTAPGTVTVGGTGTFQVALVAKDGYHINDQYPYNLRPAADPQGIVTFDVPELARKDGKYTKTDARFELKFTGARAGVAKVRGTMSLSVCTKKECVVDKIELEVPVTVR
jgi:hypothetical protein